MNNKIMVVDDEADILTAMKAFYQRNNIEVITASSGRECIKQIEHGYNGIVLLDIMMPKMDGWATIREIIRKGLADQVSIKIITGKGTEDHKKIADLAPYISDYISKPIEPETLLAIVRDN